MSERNASIFEFLFKGLVFLKISFGFSIFLNLREFVKGGLGKEVIGFLNKNLLVLCLAIPRYFLFTSRVSAYGSVSVFGKISFVMNVVSSRGSGGIKSGMIGDSRIILLISAIFFAIISSCLGVGVLRSMIIISFISLRILSPCLRIGVLNSSFSMLSICI
jgi:hypothetical protein